MNLRNLSTILWFAAGWSGAGLAVGILGLPSAWALLGGVVAAGLVRWDPSGRLWGTKPVRRIRPIEEVAAELDGHAASATSALGERPTR